MTLLGPHSRAAAYLGVVQFFFFATWIVYVVYLGDLLSAIGWDPKTVLIWFILLDQAVFALTDTAMGAWADRVERWLGQIGPWILAVNALSCAAFILLPWSVGLTPEGAGLEVKILFTALIVIWIATSSVLRAPPLVLLLKYAPRPQQSWLTALVLLGLGCGGASAPYLGGYLKQVAPELPFAISGLALFATTLGLIWIERTLPRAGAPSAPPQRQLPVPAIALVAALGLLLGLGFQIHFFLNTKPLLLKFITPGELGGWMPVFWIGFNVMVFLAPLVAQRIGAPRALIGGMAVGLFSLLLMPQAPNIELLGALLLLAGSAWGLAFMSGIVSALRLGSSGNEGLTLGVWFSALSGAALLRAILVLSETQATQLIWLPPLLWGGAIALLAVALVVNQRSSAREPLL